MNQPTVRLVTLGQLDLVLDGHGSLSALLAQPKRMAVLIHMVLAAPAGLRSRDALQAMFWPETEPARARQSLRQTLHVLRQRLPPGTLSTRGGHEVGVVADHVHCDAREFQELVNRERWEDALAVYAGELLPGLFLGESAAFHDWLERERGRLRQLAVQAALRLARQQVAADRRSDAVGTAHLATRLAPLDEVVLRDAIGVLVELGDRAAASGLYRDFVSRLRDELGLDASPETVALGAAIERPTASASVGTAMEHDPDERGAPAPIPAPAVPTTPVGLDVFHLYQKGRVLVEQRTPGAVRQAARTFEQALRLEPRFAEAHDGVAEAWMVLAVYTRVPADEARGRVLHHTHHALRLDPTLASAHAHRAWARLVYDWDWAAAERGFVRALELDPRCTQARLPYAVYLLSSMGRFDEALAQLDRARATNPTAPHLSSYVAMIRYFARDYERALKECAAVLDVAPDFPLANWVLAWTRSATGEGDAALAAAKAAVRATSGSRLMVAHQGYAAAVAGDAAQARSILRELADERPPRDPVPEFFTGAIHAALDEREIAMEQVRRAYRGRSPHVVLSGVIPLFDPLRTDRRFRELPHRMGLGGLVASGR